MVNLSPVLEDYLETVGRLQREKNFARVSDISRALEVGKSAVTAALKSLSEKGLVNYCSYEPVTLSKKGRKIAEHIFFRRRIISDFLKNVLDIEEGRAATTACRMEHSIGKEVLDRFICFLAFISTTGKEGKTGREEFQLFLKKGAGSKTYRQCVKEYLKTIEKVIPEEG